MSGREYITENLTSGENQHPLESFFGPYRGGGDLDRYGKPMRADSQLPHETYNLPRAYEGKNKFLEEVLDFKIRKEDEFYTRSLLPWEYTDDLHVAWEIFSFNRTLADLEPHQGIPRYVSAQSESHSDNLLRRGLAFIIEHGFYKTERGKRHFSLNLQQITDAIHTTCYFGVIHALLAGQNYYKEYRRKYGRQVHRVNDLMQMERRRWAIVQKKKNGLYLLDAEIKHEMKREGITPNVWVFPDKMGIYVNMVSGNALEYKERGPEAISNRESGDAKASFRGLPVFESQSFDVDFTGQPIDLMVRERQCGEYFIMKGEVKNGNTTVREAEDEMVVYNANTDNWHVLRRGDLTPNIVNINPGTDDVSALANSGVLPRSEAKLDLSADDEGLKKKDLLILRPHQTYRMASAILAKGGRELGSTFHGHHDFMLSDDIIRKVHVGHYTFYSKSVVKRPKNYVIIEDIFSQGYVGGEGVEPFKGPDAYKEALHGGKLGQGDAADLIVVACEGGSLDKINDCIDITGRFHPSVYERFTGEASDNMLEHYPESRVVYHNLGLQELDPYRQNELDEFVNRIQRINTVCFRGMELRKGVDEKWVPDQLNKGHWGENVYPGCRRVRDGENTFIQDQEYSKKIQIK